MGFFTGNTSIRSNEQINKPTAHKVINKEGTYDVANIGTIEIKINNENKIELDITEFQTETSLAKTTVRTFQFTANEYVICCYKKTWFYNTTTKVKHLIYDQEFATFIKTDNDHIVLLAASTADYVCVEYEISTQTTTILAKDANMPYKYILQNHIIFKPYGGRLIYVYNIKTRSCTRIVNLLSLIQGVPEGTQSWGIGGIYLPPNESSNTILLTGPAKNYPMFLFNLDTLTGIYVGNTWCPHNAFSVHPAIIVGNKLIPQTGNLEVNGIPIYDYIEKRAYEINSPSGNSLEKIIPIFNNSTQCIASRINNDEGCFLYDSVSDSLTQIRTTGHAYGSAAAKDNLYIILTEGSSTNSSNFIYNAETTTSEEIANISNIRHTYCNIPHYGLLAGSQYITSTYSTYLYFIPYNTTAKKLLDSSHNAKDINITLLEDNITVKIKIDTTIIYYNIELNKVIKYTKEFTV